MPTWRIERVHKIADKQKVPDRAQGRFVFQAFSAGA